jgi:hypothetical protein
VGIFCRIISVPHNIVTDLTNVMSFDGASKLLFCDNSQKPLETSFDDTYKKVTYPHVLEVIITK